MRSCEIFGLEVTLGTEDELFRAVRALIHKGGRVATVNPLMLMNAYESEEFFSVLSSFDLRIPDGFGVKLAARLRGERTEVLAGVELGKMLLSLGEVSLALVGAVPGVAEAAMQSLLAEFQQLRPAFVFDGYSYTVNGVREALSVHRPTLAYFCLSSPKQEILISEAFSASPGTLFIGLGGSLDVYSKRVRRAPKFLRRLHLEWLYRAVIQPRRLLKIPKLFVFLYLSFRERWAVLTKKSGA